MATTLTIEAGQELQWRESVHRGDLYHRCFIGGKLSLFRGQRRWLARLANPCAGRLVCFQLCRPDYNRATTQGVSNANRHRKKYGMVSATTCETGLSIQMASKRADEDWSEADAEVIKRSFDAGAQAATWDQIRDFVCRLGPTHQDIAEKLGVSRSRVSQLLQSKKLLLDRLMPLVRNNGLSIDEFSTNATAAVGGYVAAMNAAAAMVAANNQGKTSRREWPLTRTTLTQLRLWSTRCWTEGRSPGSLTQIEAVIQDSLKFIDRRRILEKGKRRVEPFEGPLAKTTGELIALIEAWGGPWQICNRYLIELWAKAALGWTARHVRDHFSGGSRY